MVCLSAPTYINVTKTKLLSHRQLFYFALVKNKQKLINASFSVLEMCCSEEGLVHMTSRKMLYVCALCVFFVCVIIIKSLSPQ